MKQHNWISVKDRLPELERHVWRSDKPFLVRCYLGNEVYVAHYARVKSCGLGDYRIGGDFAPKFLITEMYNDKCNTIGNVSHWMPLPEPPINSNQ